MDSNSISTSRGLMQIMNDLSDSFRRFRSCDGDDIDDLSINFGNSSLAEVKGGDDELTGISTSSSTCSMNSLGISKNKNSNASASKTQEEEQSQPESAAGQLSTNIISCFSPLLLLNINSNHNKNTITRTIIRRKTQRFVQQQVRFDTENIKVISIQNIDDICVSQVWYSQTELAVIQKENFFLLWKKMNGKFQEEQYDDGDHNDENHETNTNNKKKPQDTIRGLENEDPSMLNDRDETEFNAFVAVMKEQARQRRCGINNPQKIASQYRKNGAKRSQEEAYRMGINDYQNAIMISQ